jgi:hypothetical protein
MTMCFAIYRDIMWRKLAVIARPWVLSCIAPPLLCGHLPMTSAGQVSTGTQSLVEPGDKAVLVRAFHYQCRPVRLALGLAFQLI